MKTQKAKGKRRQEIQRKKQLKKTETYLQGGGESRYARKCDYLKKEGLWGFQAGEPKPWK